MTAWRQVHILGVRVDDVTMEQAVDVVARWMRERGRRVVVTPNPEIVMAARRAPSFRSILATADLAVPDGIGLIAAARLLGAPLRTTVPGVELVEALAPVSAARGDRWFLLGGRDGVAAAAGSVLAARHPGLVFAGAYEGEAAASGDEAARAAIAASGPVHLLLVAYGAPSQEQWIARNLAHLDVPVAIGVGGTFNFIAGRSPRPPQWVQGAGFGWLYRLITEPWRWRRQLVLPYFAALVLVAAARRRLARWRGDHG